KSVVLGAADTFRAAAIEQLGMWADRIGVPIVKHQAGSDPAAVAHDAVSAAKARGADVVIIDTAGRLHNKSHLMQELAKIHRVIDKELPGAPHETLLVLDGTTGQNGVNQAAAFLEAAKVTGMVVTKLDGTAKGGVILSIMRQFDIPVKFVGLGQAADAVIPLDARADVDALFEGSGVGTRQLPLFLPPLQLRLAQWTAATGVAALHIISSRPTAGPGRRAAT